MSIREAAGEVHEAKRNEGGPRQYKRSGKATPVRSDQKRFEETANHNYVIDRGLIKKRRGWDLNPP